MTEEQVKEGKAICDKIKNLEEDCESIEKLSMYIADKIIMNDRRIEDYIEIQLHEQWIHTPYAKVNITNLIGFLNTENHRIELEIQSLREKLESM